MSEDNYPFIYAQEDDSPSEEVMDLEEAQELVAAGVLGGDTMCWNDGLGDWTEWSECMGQFGFDAEEPEDEEGEEDGEDWTFYTELIYADDDGNQSEEIDTSDVQALIDAGTIDDETQVWTEGMEGWEAWGEVKHWFGFEEDAEWDPDAVNTWLEEMSGARAPRLYVVPCSASCPPGTTRACLG
jgi:hypothetical protein